MVDNAIYSVLEFYVWNPGWDDYLTKMMMERLAKNMASPRKELKED
jgi:hypothetical protein